MKHLVLAIVLASCAAPDVEPAMDGGDGDAWSPPESDPPPVPDVTLELVLDVNAQPAPIDARGFVVHDAAVYFGARTSDRDYGLFATHGSVAGTRQIATRPSWTSPPRGLLSARGLVYFTVGDQALGNELWVSDGTDAGTRVLGDVYVGADSGFYAMIGATSSGVFWAALTARGSRLWRTDGTAAGTHEVGSVSIGAQIGTVSAIVLGDRVYVGSADGPSGGELYVYEEATRTTRLVKDIRPGAEGSQPATLVALGTKVLFSADDGTHGREPWITDGTTTGTTMVIDIHAGALASLDRLTPTIVHQGAAYLSADDGVHGPELWRTNGTAAGTTLVADLVAGATGSSPRPYASVGTRLFVSANDAVHGRELFTTTGSGESLLVDLNPGANSGNPTSVVVAGSTAYFIADDGTHGSEMYRSDGTAAGTSLVSDLWPGSGAGAQAGISVVLGNRVYFTGSTSDVTFAPFTSDGTSVGTVALIPSVQQGMTAAASPGAFVAAGTKLFFAAVDADHGRELWVRDASGTHLVRDVNPGALAGIVGDPVAFGSSVGFVGADAAHGQELWVSDGTAAGTRLVRDLNPGPALGATNAMIAVGSGLYFFGDDGSVIGQELYVTDGTAAGTRLVADLDPRPSNIGYSPRMMGLYNGMLLFNARDANYNGVFRYNPTTNVTTRVTTIGLFAEEIAAVNGKTYMSIAGAMGEPGPNPGIYVTDGTAANTKRIDLRRSRAIFGLGSAIGFSYAGGIYRSDGTLGSAVLVSDAGPPDSAAYEIRLVELGGALYYIGGNGTAGTGLWRTDLTPGGTRLVHAFGIGAGSVNAIPPEVLGDKLYFAAGDGPTGTELWRSDGTTTELVRDVWQGPRSGTPRNFRAIDGALYVSLDDGMHGAEPWRLTAP